MNDVVGVAVVHALQHLLHEDRGVLLGELSSGDDLVEELSTLANPNQELNIIEQCLPQPKAGRRPIKSKGPQRAGHLLSHDVVALLVLEELVHLHDVGVILQGNES